jgi:hypothetical protein
MLTAEADAGALAAVRDFARNLAHASWFAACGEALSEGELLDARAYVAALGQCALEISAVGSWRDAAATAQRPDWSRDWWDAEARAQRDLQRQAAARFGDETLLAALTAVTEAADALHGAAAVALNRAGLADPTLTRVAAGAAAQACHQAALALAASAGPDHLFSSKYRLFAAGRWPLGIVGGCFFVF